MKKLWDWGWGLYRKYREILNYLIFGGLTTVVSLVTFMVADHLIPDFSLFGFSMKGYWAANLISWILSVLFAYITNKLFVFESKSFAPGLIAREMASFFGCRLFSLVIEMGVLTLMVEACHISEFWSKVTTQVIVVILNYVFSKLFIFKKKTKKDDKT